MVFLLQPSSAAAERVFSILKASFGERQDLALQDYIETSSTVHFCRSAQVETKKQRNISTKLT